MKILLSWSSGKDSTWMLHHLRRSGAYHISALLTTVNEVARRVAMHAVRIELLEAQARAAGLPLWTIPLPDPCPNEEYEQRLGEAVRRAVSEGFTHVAFGDLFLEDVRAYREHRLAGSGLTPMFPLWRRPTGALALEMLREGVRAKLTCVDTRALDARFVGREYDARLLAELPSHVDPCGERGEFHTFVYDGPMFPAPIRVAPGETVRRDAFVFADLLPRWQA